MWLRPNLILKVIDEKYCLAVKNNPWDIANMNIFAFSKKFKVFRNYLKVWFFIGPSLFWIHGLN